jgi:universal stress protein A
MFSAERILFPTDFSDCSKSVLPYVLSFAEAHKSSLTLLNVVEFEEMQHLVAGTGASEVEGSYLAKRTEALQAMVGPHPEIHIDFVVREGHAFKEILRLADESDIDIIIMATHGRTGFEHILIGSVAEKVVRHSDRPVLIVKPQKDAFRRE